MSVESSMSLVFFKNVWTNFLKCTDNSGIKDTLEIFFVFHNDLEAYIVISHKNSLGEPVLMRVTTYINLGKYEKLSINYPSYPFLYGALSVTKF